MKRKKRRLHLAKAATAAEIRRSLGIKKRDLKAALRAISDAGTG